MYLLKLRNSIHSKKVTIIIYSFLKNTARIIISSMYTYRRTGNNCSLSQVAKNSEIVLLEFFSCKPFISNLFNATFIFIFTHFM